MARRCARQAARDLADEVGVSGESDARSSGGDVQSRIPARIDRGQQGGALGLGEVNEPQCRNVRLVDQRDEAREIGVFGPRGFEVKALVHEYGGIVFHDVKISNWH